MAQQNAALEKSKNFKGGTLLFAGGTDWARLGRMIGRGKKMDPKEEEKQEKLFPNLLDPTRLKVLAGVKIMFVAAGPAAVHCLAGDDQGRLYTWGRNEKGQLGHGDLINRNSPKIVEGLSGKHMAGAAGGRHHSIAFTSDGEAYAWGYNMQGQLGSGSVRKGATKANEDIQTTPVKSLLQKCTACAAGMDFSMWIAGGGKLYSAGNPQYGQLGDGSDHSYNAKDSSIAIVYEPQPQPRLVAALAEKTITRVACGHNHTIAVDDAGSCYTWGSGNYGRLGHRVQRDEMAPKKVEEFRGRITIPADAVIAAGSQSTFCTASLGGQMQQLYSWGKLKTNGDGLMYPVADQNLSGWNVRSIACGPQHFVIAADMSVITWGYATNGELAYGQGGRKTSANASKVDSLDEVYTHQVAAGTGFTMFLVDSEAPQIQKLPEWQSEAPDTSSSGADEEAGEGGGGGGKGGGKRKGGTAEPAPKRGKK